MSNFFWDECLRALLASKPVSCLPFVPNCEFVHQKGQKYPLSQVAPAIRPHDLEIAHRCLGSLRIAEANEWNRAGINQGSIDPVSDISSEETGTDHYTCKPFGIDAELSVALASNQFFGPGGFSLSSLDEVSSPN